MQEIKFSVIVPVLNGEAHLEQCLDSILQQAVKPELIVIDGGSTDRTLDIISSHSRFISYWESGKDTGIANAFNRGLLHAKGEIISILNYDDFWEPCTLETLLHSTLDHPEASIYFAWCRIHPESETPFIKKPNLPAMKRYMSVSHPATFIRKTAYHAIGYYNEGYKFAMDAEWIHRAIKTNLVMQTIPVPLANMRMGGTSDINAPTALREYQRSIIDNQIASSAYATLFLWLHLSSKLADSFWLSRRIKQHLNKMINRTVEYEHDPS